VLAAPPNKEEIIVFKVSSYYPDLPEELKNPMHSIIYQKPFNSTIYDPQLNFAHFLSDNYDCCLLIIKVPKGSNILLIDPSIHAYPHEREQF